MPHDDDAERSRRRAAEQTRAEVQRLRNAIEELETLQRKLERGEYVSPFQYAAFLEDITVATRRLLRPLDRVAEDRELSPPDRPFLGNSTTRLRSNLDRVSRLLDDAGRLLF